MGDGWRKMADVTPEHLQYCIVWMPGREVAAAQWDGLRGIWWDGGHGLWWDDTAVFGPDDLATVTHWRPMPEPPAEGDR